MSDVIESSQSEPGNVGVPRPGNSLFIVRSQWLSLARWLLALGMLGTLALPYIPWLMVSFCPLTSCSGQANFFWGFNPLQAYPYQLLAQHPTVVGYVQIFLNAILTIALAPGILCFVWVRGRIISRGQRMGVVVYSVWFLFWLGFTCAALHSTIPDARHALFNVTPTLQPAAGIFLWGLVIVLLGLGLILLWRELWQNRKTVATDTFRQLSPLEYVGAALLTAGMTVWFIGFFGIYWLLPPDCPTTPLFGEAACNNRMSTESGYGALFANWLTPQTAYIRSVTYWELSALVVFGGVTFIIALWLRRGLRTDVLLVSLWCTALALLTCLSAWGVQLLTVTYPDVGWTNGVLITLVGIGLVAAGLVVRWRYEGQASSHRAISGPDEA